MKACPKCKSVSSTRMKRRGLVTFIYRAKCYDVINATLNMW